MARLSIALSLIVAAVGATIGAEVMREPPLVALGLDSRKSLEQNLVVLAEPTELIPGVWSGSVGALHVQLVGNNLAAPPDVITVSTPSIYSQQAVEETLGLDANSARVVACPAELLMDDGIGCSAVFYGCDETTRRCRVLATTYQRDDLPDYPPFPGNTSVGWSSEGYALPAP